MGRLYESEYVIEFGLRALLRLMAGSDDELETGCVVLGDRITDVLRNVTPQCTINPVSRQI